MKWLVPVLVILTFAIFLWVYTIIGLTFVNRWSQPTQGKVGDKLYSSKQPNDIDYHSYGPYELLVTRQLSRTYPFAETQYATIEIFHAGETHEDHYGWSMDIGWSGFDTMTTKWTADGVELVKEGGLRLFIPKKYFIGGR